MYLAVCDDQADELDILVKLLDQWQNGRRVALRYKAFRSAAALLDAAATDKKGLGRKFLSMSIVI